MSISGPQALSSLDDALRDIRREEDEIAKRLARSNERIAKHKETEAELFKQLAMVRLDPTTQSQLQGQISQAEISAREQLKKHAGDLEATETALRGLDERLSRLNEQRSAALGDIDRQQGELKALASRIKAAIEKDPNYAARLRHAADLEAVAAQSLRKTELADADREQKGRPYRQDPLFMYLWERGYGTSAYRASNLVRWLDGKVADLVGFPKARPNYAMLNDLPVRLREHADRQAGIAREARDAVDALETAAIDSAGGKPMREGIEAARKTIETLDAEIVAVEDERDERAQMLRDLAQGSDPAFAKALDAFAQGLGREDLQQLLSDARRTATAQDDTLIAQIDDVRARQREEDAETRGERDRLKTLAARRRELEDIQYEFKRARYDDPRSTFREDRLVGDLLNDFLRGGISAASYWDQWRKSQNWSSGTSDWGGGVGIPHKGRNSPWGWNDDDDDRGRPSGGGFQWPDSSFGGGSGGGRRSGGNIGGWGRLPGGSGGGGGSSGGGFSRPRGGSSGNRTHGGFKTGGRF